MGLIYLLVFLTSYIVLSVIYELIFGVRKRTSEEKMNQILGKSKKKSKKREYKLNINFQYVIAIIGGVIISNLTGNYIYFFVTIIVSISFNRYLKIYNNNRLREIFVLQFKDFLISLSSSIKAGNSLENSIIKSENDLMRIHDTNKIMINEIIQMKNEISFGYDLKKVLTQFKKRNNIDEVVMFVNSVLIVEEKGGNTNEVISIVSKTIVDKIEMKQQIEKLTAAKKLEANLLSVLPIVIAVVMYFMSPKYFEPMTKTLLGNALLVLSVVLIVVNHFVSKKIVEIDI